MKKAERIWNYVFCVQNDILLKHKKILFRSHYFLFLLSFFHFRCKIQWNECGYVWGLTSNTYWNNLTYKENENQKGKKRKSVTKNELKRIGLMRFPLYGWNNSEEGSIDMNVIDIEGFRHQKENKDRK